MKWNPIGTLEFKNGVSPHEIVSETVLLWVNSKYFIGSVIGSMNIYNRSDGSKYKSISPHGISGREWDWDFEFEGDDLACVTHWAELPKGPQE